jgi:hypothetical protein
MTWEPHGYYCNQSHRHRSGARVCIVAVNSLVSRIQSNSMWISVGYPRHIVSRPLPVAELLPVIARINTLAVPASTGRTLCLQHV